jgi:septal ring factor EnvC (AmiA/AmiB activator)
VSLSVSIHIHTTLPNPMARLQDQKAEEKEKAAAKEKEKAAAKEKAAKEKATKEKATKEKGETAEKRGKDTAEVGGSSPPGKKKNTRGSRGGRQARGRGQGRGADADDGDEGDDSDAMEISVAEAGIAPRSLASLMASTASAPSLGALADLAPHLHAARTSLSSSSIHPSPLSGSQTSLSMHQQLSDPTKLRELEDQLARLTSDLQAANLAKVQFESKSVAAEAAAGVLRQELTDTKASLLASEAKLAAKTEALAVSKAVAAAKEETASDLRHSTSMWAALHMSKESDFNSGTFQSMMAATTRKNGGGPATSATSTDSTDACM